jgi:hypothetical protein
MLWRMRPKLGKETRGYVEVIWREGKARQGKANGEWPGKSKLQGCLVHVQMGMAWVVGCMWLSRWIGRVVDGGRRWALRRARVRLGTDKRVLPLGFFHYACDKNGSNNDDNNINTKARAGRDPKPSTVMLS